MMKISTLRQIREMDSRAIADYGLTEDLLMENAGSAAYYVILKEFGVKNKSFIVFCGGGNNGGDGLVVARKLVSGGGKVSVCMTVDPSKVKGAAKRNFERAQLFPVDFIDFDDSASLKERLYACDGIVDALFGTGLDRELQGRYKELILAIKRAGKTVFSIDIPSGINGDTAEVMGEAVRAAYTISFGLPKLGNILYPGNELCGKLYIHGISLPPALLDGEDIKIAVNGPLPLPRRASDTHKGDFGKALFIAGASSYPGAPYFAALSFLKAGGGLSYLAAPDCVSARIGSKAGELVYLPQKSTVSGGIAYENKEGLLAKAKKADFVVLGPGLSLDEETQKLAAELCLELDRPLLIDGDGLSAAAESVERLAERTEPTILTPHLGEMARLVKFDIEYIKKNRIEIAKELAEACNCIVVLKGARTLIAHPDGRVFINLSGNAGMATAGSGDVLSGVIAAMFGLGLPSGDAARLGVFTHGLAGDLAADAFGQDGLIAGNILDSLPTALKRLRENYHSVTENCYNKIYTL